MTIYRELVSGVYCFWALCSILSTFMLDQGWVIASIVLVNMGFLIVVKTKFEPILIQWMLEEYKDE